MDSIPQPLPQPLTPPPGGVDPRTLPFVPLGDRATLPPIACIYFCIGADERILYIDATCNLNQKWIANRQYNHLATITSVRIAWLEVIEPEELDAIKQAMIEYWEPMLNDWRYKLQQIQDLTIDGWHDFHLCELGNLGNVPRCRDADPSARRNCRCLPQGDKRCSR